MKKISEFYEKHKFPLTVEPLLLFWSVGFGLTEVWILVDDDDDDDYWLCCL